MPPPPKHPSTRARKNRTSTNAVLTVDHDVKQPPLPKGVEWHPMTRAWWRDIWTSPMAPEFLKADIHGLFQLALLTNDFWEADTPSKRSAIAAEMRQQGQRYGLSPIDRRRLQWEVEKVEDAQARGQQRRGSQAPQPRPQQGEDPRKVALSVVK
jgi:hypothetical protein